MGLLIDICRLIEVSFICVDRSIVDVEANEQGAKRATIGRDLGTRRAGVAPSEGIELTLWESILRIAGVQDERFCEAIPFERNISTKSADWID